jgi:ADP-ribose pyrophosphatase YjhB (NUDIX family)
MLVERPDVEQWQELVRNYGTPHFSDRVWNRPERMENATTRTCAGGVILMIFNLAGSCSFVRRKGSDDWFFPMGPIRFGEPILEAARREAMEETGVPIVPVGVPLCQRVTMNFRNAVLERWHLLVVAETAFSDLSPLGHGGIEEARLFDKPPKNGDGAMKAWMDELYLLGSNFLSSLDSLDGI